MPTRYPGRLLSATRPTVTQSSSGAGMFTGTEVTQYIQANVWSTRPDSPTSVTALAGNAQAIVSFTPPANNGGSAITSYIVTSSPGGITASGANSPITITGLTNNTNYTFTVVALNALGPGTASSPSASVTPSDADFTITPAVDGVSNWRFATNGSLVLTVSGEYNIAWLQTASRVVKMWGAAGGTNYSASNSQNIGWGGGGGGGAAVGTVNFIGGTTYKLRVPSFGLSGSTPANAYGAGASGGVFSTGTAGSGGGYAGLFEGSVSHANAILMAGGGGGGASCRGDGLGGRYGAAGGGTTGTDFTGDFVAGSGTQSAGGAARGSGSPTSGSALQGGNGSSGGGGGGGGYYGGGGGGSQGDGGYGAGGGSGYAHPTKVTSVTLYQGSGINAATAGNNSDPDIPTNSPTDNGGTGRAGRAGNVNNGFRSANGAIIIKA